MKKFSIITFFFRSTVVTHPSGLSPQTRISSLSDDPIEVDSGWPAFKWGHLSLIHQGSPKVCVFPHGLTRGFKQCVDLGLLRAQLPVYLFLLRWTFLIGLLIWSWGISLCFNNTCDKIYFFAFKVVNYGVHLKWVITAKKEIIPFGCLHAFMLRRSYKQGRVMKHLSIWTVGFEGDQTGS